jgi:hypothetical protein
MTIVMKAIAACLDWMTEWDSAPFFIGLIHLWDLDVILRSEADWHDQKAHASLQIQLPAVI